MVQFVRIVDKPGAERTTRLEAVLRKAEELTSKVAPQLKAGKLKSAKALRKMAHSKARMAMRLMGILNIEYGEDVTDGIKRTRAILEILKK